MQPIPEKGSAPYTSRCDCIYENLLANKMHPEKARTITGLAEKSWHRSKTPTKDETRGISYAACAFGRKSPLYRGKSPVCMQTTFASAMAAIAACRTKHKPQ